MISPNLAPRLGRCGRALARSRAARGGSRSATRFTHVAVLAALAGCAHDRAVPIAPPPVRDAVGDADLRMMIAEIATAKACDRINDHFHALRDGARHDIVSGMVWFHGCTSVHDGTNVTFTVAGSGWQWIDKTTHEAGGTFAVRQYVRFNAKATIVGTLDLGYDASSHVASLWFSPSHAPTVELDPIGDIDVAHTGAWSSVVGTVGSVFARSPDRQGAKEAKRQGTQQFLAQLSEGLTVTIDLCTGVARSTVGHLPKGQLAPPDVLEPSRTELELQPGGVLMLGPQRAQDGMTVHVDRPAPPSGGADARGQAPAVVRTAPPSGGADGAAVEAAGQIEVSLACRDDAEAVARAYLGGTPLPTIPTLASTRVNGPTELKLAGTHCPVAVIARSLATTGPAIEFTVQRASTEIGTANGGPLVGCPK